MQLNGGMVDARPRADLKSEGLESATAIATVQQAPIPHQTDFRRDGLNVG